MIKRELNKHNDCLQDFFKLRNNAPYGKFFENITKRLNIMLLADKNKAVKHTEKRNCTNFRLFDKSLLSPFMRKLWHLINKPFQHELTVLEISKRKIYSFYVHLKKYFKKRVRKMYTDTYSFFFLFYVDDLPKTLN